MTTIQMTIDEKLLQELDQIIKETNSTRSAFIRKSIANYLNFIKMKQLEKKHKDGYIKKPVTKDEFSIWEDEQEWGN